MRRDIIEKIKKHKGKIFILLFLIFTIIVIVDTMNVKQEVKVETPKVAVKKKTKKKETETNKIIVDVKGAVTTPGVYELTDTNTVMDAINIAGGLTRLSDTSNINLSKKLTDEMVIIVYTKEEIRKMKTETTSCPTYNNACVTESDEKAKITNTETNQKVNINTADITTLQTLSGIGESKAEAIIEYREKNGNFQKIEDIKNVSGIGDAVYEKIKDNITV